MKKFFNGLVCVVLLLAISGCSIFGPYTETITVTGAQEDATIIINGMRTSTGTLDVRSNKPVNIIVKKEGYKPWYAHSSTTLSATGIADVIGCFLFLVPGVGLFFPGAFNHTQTYFYYDLQQLDK
jgi:hypothetical protein